MNTAIRTSENLQITRSCDIRFDLFVDGAPRRVSASGKVTSCACAGMDGFRVALHFTQMDDGSAEMIDKLLQFA